MIIEMFRSVDLHQLNSDIAQHSVQKIQL